MALLLLVGAIVLAAVLSHAGSGGGAAVIATNGDRAEFASKFLAAARQVDMKGIPVNIALAQSALEVGWGSQSWFPATRNLFNIKAGSSWKGDVFRQTLSKPDADGNTVRVWRVYPSWAASIKDWVNLVSGLPRYHGAYALMVAGDYRGAFAALQAAGYAGDPAGPAKTYAAALVKVYEAVA